MKRILLLLAVVIIISACSEEYLTVDPQATLFASEYFSDLDQVEEALIATYDVLGHQKGTKLAWAPPLFVAEILSDDAFAGGQDAGDGAEEDELNTFSISTGNEMVRSIWKKNFFGIYRTNFTIDKAEVLRDTNQERADQIIAESKFLRAYFYFELVRHFERVPVFTSIPSGLDDGNRAQSNPEEVYNLIASDLLDAFPDLPQGIGSGRATSWAAKSLLGRVYLFENGVYGNGMDANGTSVTAELVLSELEDVINNSGHDLLPNYSDVFTAANEFSIESVFEISYAGAPVGGDFGTEQYIEGNLAAQMMGPRVTGSTIYYRGWSFGTITNKLFLDMQGDPRLDATILTEATILSEPGASLNTGAYQHTGYYNNKYTTRLSDRGTLGTPELHNMTNYRAIRFSDVLLMAAEIGQNVNYINRVRSRVGLPDLANYSNDALFKERRMELAGEGQRYFDLLRRGSSVAESELTVVGDIGPFYTGSPVVYDVTFNAATRGFLPIPQVEIDLSKGVLEQNQGY